MKRLTKKVFDGVYRASCENCPNHNDRDCYFPAGCQDALEKRLAAYEDTGLEPEEIMGLCEMDRRAKMADMLRTEEEFGVSIDRLRELAQAEKEGRLVVLPSQDGDMDWREEEDLVRRALLGDKSEQGTCTAREIVLPCPCCGNHAIISKTNHKYSSIEYKYEVRCSRCGLLAPFGKTYLGAISNWNNRTKPPFGRCWECAWYHKDGHGGGYCGQQGPGRAPSDFCSWFKPKEADD